MRLWVRKYDLGLTPFDHFLTPILGLAAMWGCNPRFGIKKKTKTDRYSHSTFRIERYGSGK